jgi:hypothetical protein
MQMAQAAQQPQQPPQQPFMMPPPLGQEPEGDVANIAQNAGLGAAIQSQQQQQAQQAMMQMAQQQQQAQQQPAMMASGGIAGLAADNMRGFKEGGVLGFAKEPLLVPDPDETQKAAVEQQETAKTKAELRANRAAAILAMMPTPGDRVGLNRIPAASISPQTDTVPEGIIQLPVKRPVESVQIPGSNAIAEAIKQLRESKEIKETAYADPSRRLDVPVSSGKPPVAGPSVAGPSVAGPSVARLTSAANVPSPPAAPALDLPGFLAQVRGATPEQPNVFLDKQAAAQEELNKLRAAQPAPNQVALQALLDAQQKRAKLSAEDEAGAGGRGLAALFQGMMGRNESASVAAHNEREKQRRRLDIAETLADKEKESAIRDIQAAKAAGDKEKEAAGYKDLGASKQKSQEIQALREGQSIQAAYHLKTKEMENASAEKLQLMRQRHENAIKTMPNWEQAQIKAQVDKLAGPNASIKEILAATETVLSSHNKAGESNEIKRLKLGIDAGKVWDEAHKLDIANALNKPAEQQKIAIARQQAIDNAMNVQSSTSQNPYGGPPPAGKVVRE